MNTRQHHHDEPEEELPPSKTKIKKQMLELQDLGKTLTALSNEKLRELNLDENLFEAILEYKRITKFGAPAASCSTSAVSCATWNLLPSWRSWMPGTESHASTRPTWLHQVEHWRDRLIEQPDALTELLAAHPEADAQRLRALIRNAQKEKEALKPAKSYRELFQVLREIIPEPLRRAYRTA